MSAVVKNGFSGWFGLDREGWEEFPDNTNYTGERGCIILSTSTVKRGWKKLWIEG